MQEVHGAEHCSVASCMQLDFLPFKCDACGKVYCQQHFAYGNHDCPAAERSSVQVLICPMCGESVRMSPSEDPNVTWDRHFHSACSRVLPAKKTSKKCPVVGCKETLGPSNRVECGNCSLTFCLKHRLPEDHQCAGKATASGSSRKNVPAPSRAAPSQAAKTQGQVSMDERLARQLQEEEIQRASAGAWASRPEAERSGTAASSAPAGQRAGKKKLSDRISSAFQKGMSMVRGKQRENQRLLG
mmetsp:Transcript_13168/g.24297  ORF Transcript_13168/g.24297 Transcript_13168/m.24297 type:complete len:243 (+) Transcript_13168:61-789(+)